MPVTASICHGAICQHLDKSFRTDYESALPLTFTIATRRQFGQAILKEAARLFLPLLWERTGSLYHQAIMFLSAAIQLTSTSDESANIESAEALIRRAASCGAKLIATPENTNFLGPQREKIRRAEPLTGSIVTKFTKLAEELNVHLLLGSVNERSDDPERCYNTTVLLSPDGQQLAVYRKIHLFDVDVPPDVCFQESAATMAGDEVVVAETALGTVGLSICYDLRFPELYRQLVDRGAEIITVPSAFTLTTGKDHWSTLIRARAIECQAYIIAPAQSGRHDDNGLRHSYGHTMIVDPWGQETAVASDGPGIALAEIDLERVADVRRRMPVNRHRRL